MRDWSLSFSTATVPGDPLSLTLAADMRLCKPDYLNDHIWELEITAGEVASLAVRTTYGLRARNMRLFYRFDEGGQSVTTCDRRHPGWCPLVTRSGPPGNSGHQPDKVRPDGQEFPVLRGCVTVDGRRGTVRPVPLQMSWQQSEV